MDELKKEIRLLKAKINNEIESFRIYEELAPICDLLAKEIDNYEYDENNDLSLRKYRAYLEVLLDIRIGIINRMIVENENKSVLDNRTAEAEKELTDLEKELESVLTYIDENLPAIGVEATEKYNAIKSFYTDLIEYTKGSIARSLAADVGAKDGKYSEPVLSLYADTSAVNRVFIAHLIDYRYRYIDSINKFVENDKKIKETILKAYESDNPKTIELVKQIDAHYKDVIAQCMESGNILANLLLPKIQDNVKEIILQLDEIVEAEEKKKEYREELPNMKLNDINIKRLLEIEEFVVRTGELSKEFYKTLYVLVEKEKYLVSTFGEKPILYNQLSEESKLALEKVFIERLGERDQEIAQEQIKKLKKDGYQKVLDDEYEKYFKGLDYKEIPSYKFTKIEDPVILQCKPYADKMDRKYFVISNKKTGKNIDVTRNERCYSVDDSFSFKNGIYELIYRHFDRYGFHKYTHYKSWDEEGNRIKVPRDVRVIQKVFGRYYITLFYNKEEWHYRLTDLNGKSLYREGSLNFFDEYLIDNEKNRIIINNHSTNTLKVYNEDLELKKSIDIDKIREQAKLGESVSIDTKPSIDIGCCTDNDVLAISFGNVIVYYESFFDKVLEKFIDTHPGQNRYGASESTLVYKEGDNSYGYKDHYGSVVLKPIYREVHPFYGGVAMVKDESLVTHLIDKKGNDIDITSYLGKGWKIVISHRKNRYEIHDKDDNIYTIEPSYRYVLGSSDLLITSAQHCTYLSRYERHHL